MMARLQYIFSFAQKVKSSELCSVPRGCVKGALYRTMYGWMFSFIQKVSPCFFSKEVAVGGRECVSTGARTHSSLRLLHLRILRPFYCQPWILRPRALFLVRVQSSNAMRMSGLPISNRVDGRSLL